MRQSRRYPLWRVAYAYHPQVAVRLICWFPPGAGTVVVALYATDKAKLGDVFYDGAAARAGPGGATASRPGGRAQNTPLGVLYR